MFRRRWAHPALLAIVAFAVAFVFVTWLIPDRPGSEDLPEFDQENVDERKQAFFDYLRPIVRYYNERIAEEREWLLDATESGPPNWLARRRLRELAERYRIDMESVGLEETIELLWRRVDTVPESLVLIQAAKESGWGRSRFAREGNALFGQRCYEEGCGIVPGARTEKSMFEVQSFETAAQSVESYIRNLNTHDRYIVMRRARHQLRQRGADVSGTELAAYLDDYSERGPAYVAEIQSMIRQNDLEANNRQSE